ncbi:DEAD/DEAH box helicase [bacterium]|nr:DEAD/DEAH box helicase [bacterium]
MQIRDLEREGIPRRVVELWRVDQGESLLPVQSRAVRAGLVRGIGLSDRGAENLVITAPTSSGKSFCAEMAALKCLTERHRAIWLVPLKSLAEQIGRHLESRYKPLGIRTLIVTGDHHENDRAFAEGDYQIAVAIYEKLDLLATVEMDRLAGVGLCIVDELQMLAEPGRGAVLERLLTKLLVGHYQPRLIGLSASISDHAARQLADWLRAELVQENARPLDLYRGVAADGSFRYRSFNSGADGSEPFLKPEPGQDQIEIFLDHLHREGGSTLVFLKSRQDTMALAFRLAAAVNWPPAAEAVAALETEEPSFLSRSLIQALRRGVAFHNADLTPKQREVVEDAFLQKKVRVVFSTTTLAMGVNLPADTVYLETVKYASGMYDGRPALVPISRAEFDNMTGRAGRLGHAGEAVGRAIVLADSEFDREVLWESYIAPPQADCLCSQLGSMPPADWALNLVASRLARSESELGAIYEQTLRGRLEPEFTPVWSAALSQLCAAGLILESEPSGHFETTAAGRALAGTGLSVADGIGYMQRLEAGYPETMFGWTALALSGRDWRRPPGMLSRAELADQTPLRTLYQRYDHAVVEASCLLPENHRQEPLSYHQAAALKALLLLDEWTRLVPAQRLEERFQIHLGQIMSLGETVAHLVSSLASLVAATDRNAPVIERLRTHAFSLRTGLPGSMQRLYQRFGRLLGRAEFAGLRNLGVETPADLVSLSDSDLRQAVKNHDKRMEINNKTRKYKEEVQMKPVTFETTPVVLGEPEVIEIDGSQDRERFVVRINGQPVRLTGKSFKYFAKLAWSRQNAESGWMYKEDIEAGFNQARYLYRMKNEVNAGLGTDWPVVENNRLGYYRLDVDPSKIRFNRSALKEHPDWEVRSLFEMAGDASDSASAGLTH